MAWQWYRAGQEAAETLKLLRPYLITKREEAEILILVAAEQAYRGNQPGPRDWWAQLSKKMKQLKGREWKRLTSST
jgi:hypothetical protein